MRNHLLRVASLLLLMGVVVVQQRANAQDNPPKPKSEADYYSGHQLYKMSKIYDSEVAEYGTSPKKVNDNAVQRMQYELELLQDPQTGRIPLNIRENELEFLHEMAPVKGNILAKHKSKVENRGPVNVGGRTRALAIDRTNEDVILAGGVSGGLWRSTDGGQSWKRVTKDDQHPSITCIVQDPRPGKDKIWYYGTGEGVGNSASAAGAFFQGNGVFVSKDGGKSFKPSKNTADDDPVNFSPFDIITNIAVHPVTGDVYVSTRDGIHKSTNGAKDFTEVLAGGFPNWTDLIITGGGVLYASVEASSSAAGIYTSTDGDNWTAITPPTFAVDAGRTVLGYAPSSENIVFAFAESEAFALGYLYEYDANTDTWVDLSANLPAIGGSVGSLNTQTSYNLVVKVHPTNPNLVFVGGTNLYRSFDAFRTPAGQDSWIGGYSPLNNVSLYTNQHPDQHALVFYPSDPNRAISGNDGGLHRAADITEVSGGIEPVTWESLNNGYITTQPYTVAFDPGTESESLLAGFQDNSTWFTSSDDEDDPWTDLFSGDGSYCAIADGGLTRYVSAQRGIVYRLNYANPEDVNFTSFTRVQPAGASGFAFIAPFILDHRNDNIMYMPAGNTIWRNSDLDGIPIFSNAPATVNWTQMTNSAAPSRISALDVSTYPEANKLYYGTSTGGVYRIDNANFSTDAAVDLSTGKGLPLGNVVCVTVDPTDSDKVFVVFSNYNIPSVFYSKDAGETWTDIGGNLEENKDGTGTGPSTRWLAVEGDAEGYFLGTSVGLFTTKKIKGKKQKWSTKDFDKIIGEQVVPQVRTRDDGFVAVAVHGNGLYSGETKVKKRPEAKLNVGATLSDYLVDLNQPDTAIDIQDVFVLEDKKGKKKGKKDKIDITVTNSNPGLVTATLNGDLLEISYAPNAEGIASVGLVATSGKETVAEGFAITVTELPFYEQFGPQVGSRPSQFFPDFGSIIQTAADIEVPAGEQWTIARVFAPGGANNGPTLNSASVVIYADAGGVPGAEVYNSGNIVPANPVSTNMDLTLNTPAVLSAGTYWISVYANLNFFPNFTQWFWSTQAQVVGQQGYFRDPGNLFGAGLINWVPASVFGGVTDQVFQLYGSAGSTSVAPVTETAETLADELEEGLLETVEAPVKVNVWPNPSASVFRMSFSGQTESDKVISIYDLQGKVLNSLSIPGEQVEYVWDASGVEPGLYLVKVQTEIGSHLFRVLKR